MTYADRFSATARASKRSAHAASASRTSLVNPGQRDISRRVRARCSACSLRFLIVSPFLMERLEGVSTGQNNQR